MYIYRKHGLTASAHLLMPSRRRLGFLDGHTWCCHIHYSRSDGLSWRRHKTKAKLYWPVTCCSSHSSLANTWRRHMLRRDAVKHCSQLGLLRLCRFLHFFTPKTPEIASFVIFLSKVPKMRKGTTLGEIRSYKYELGLKRTPKNVTFFASSNTLTLEICLSSSKCAFILIKIQVRGLSMQT